MEHKTGCLVCGQELLYLSSNELVTCYYCGQQQATNVRCSSGHYVCDRCHSLSADDLIEQFCTHTDQTDPLEMAITLMKNPALKMHGPEHHFLVPAVLLTAYHNSQGASAAPGEGMTQAQTPEASLPAWIKKARKRAEDVKGGSCGFCGACGAGIGTGIFISVMTGSTPLSKWEWRLSNQMTAESLRVIAEHGGPRCCKRDTYLALLTAGKFLQEHFNRTLPMDEQVRCEFHLLNRECLELDCPFFPAET